MFHLKYVHSTSELVRGSRVPAPARTALKGHHCPAGAGHSTVLAKKGRQGSAKSHKKKVTGEGRKLEWSQRLSSPLFAFILVSRSILGTNSRVCLLFTVLVLKSSREKLENQFNVLNGRH